LEWQSQEYLLLSSFMLLQCAKTLTCQLMEGNELWGPIQEPEAAYECYPSTNNYKRGKHDAGLQQCCVIKCKNDKYYSFQHF